jgi:hypothetical protein
MIAIEIARADGPEAQIELLKGYETGQLNQVSIRTVKRLMEQRRLLGKKRSRIGRSQSRPSASAHKSWPTLRRSPLTTLSSSDWPLAKRRHLR